MGGCGSLLPPLARHHGSTQLSTQNLEPQNEGVEVGSSALNLPGLRSKATFSSDLGINGGARKVIHN